MPENAPTASSATDVVLLERLVRVETKLDMALDGQARSIDDVRKDLIDAETRIDRRLTDHDTRLRRVEKAIWVTAGVAAAVGSAVGTSAAGYIGRVLGG